VLTALKRAGFVAEHGTTLPERLEETWRKRIRLSVKSSRGTQLQDVEKIDASEKKAR
jgi:hypothetical protein